MYKNILFLLSFVFFPFILFSQSISNVQHRQEGDRIIITYDMDSEMPLDITVYLSTDGGKSFSNSPLRSISGDVGREVRPGNGKQITWNVFSEMDILYGDVAFRIKGFSKFGIFADSRDGKKYKTVKIGNQTWMAENLNYSTSSGSWCYDNSSSNCSQYGRLYDWETAKRVAPYGWHLPSKSEWETLLRNCGGEGANAYNQMILGGSSGFNALFGGCRYGSDDFDGVGGYADFWSSSEYSRDYAWSCGVGGNGERARLYGYSKGSGYSVRCVKD